MGGRQIEHSSSKLGQSVGSVESPCLCVKPVKQLFLFPCYNMFALPLFLFFFFSFFFFFPVQTAWANYSLCVSAMCVIEFTQLT